MALAHPFFSGIHFDFAAVSTLCSLALFLFFYRPRYAIRGLSPRSGRSGSGLLGYNDPSDQAVFLPALVGRALVYRGTMVPLPAVV